METFLSIRLTEMLQRRYRRRVPDVRVAHPDECAADASRVIMDHLGSTDPVIGLATGRSTTALHRHLLSSHRAGRTDLGRATWVMLDEFVGIAPTDPRSFRNQLCRDFVTAFDAAATSLVGPDLGLVDPSAICTAFRSVASGLTPGVQVLGIGRNGHVGFNEPGSAADSGTRLVDLSASTLADLDPAEWPVHDRPARAVTRGIADIAAARTIVLLAFGTSKAGAIAAALNGPATADCPASLLRDHADLRVFVDRDAASLL